MTGKHISAYSSRQVDDEVTGEWQRVLLVCATAFCSPHSAPLAELVTREGINQGGIKERRRGEVGAMDEVSVLEGGMEEKRVNFWVVHLGIGGGKDVSDCDGKAV